MVDDHEDYETGAAPAAHKVSHQDGGTDEISVAGLAGVPAELAVHALLPSIHHLRYTDVEAAAAAAALITIHAAVATAHQNAPQLILDHKGDAVAHQNAPQLILDHKGDAGAHHAKYTDGAAQTVADARILIHKNLATAHQDAPTLIENHRLVPGAHHAKYTDAEVRVLSSPISIGPSAFIPAVDNQDWYNTNTDLRNRVALTVQYFYANVAFLNSVTVTKLTLYGYRDDAASVLKIVLYRINSVGGGDVLAEASLLGTGGYGSKEDIIILTPVIDNTTYSYCIRLEINPNNSILDCRFTRAEIEFTG